MIFFDFVSFIGVPLHTMATYFLHLDVCIVQKIWENQFEIKFEWK